MSGNYEFDIEKLAKSEDVDVEDLEELLKKSTTNAEEYENNLNRLRIKKQLTDKMIEQMNDGSDHVKIVLE